MEEEKIVIIDFGFPSYWLYKNTFVKCCESFEQVDRGLSEPVPKVDIFVVCTLWFVCALSVQGSKHFDIPIATHVFFS